MDPSIGFNVGWRTEWNSALITPSPMSIKLALQCFLIRFPDDFNTWKSNDFLSKDTG